MSCRLVCFCSAFMNGARPKCYMALYRKKIHSHIKPRPEESAIMPGWTVFREEKYILNYNTHMAQQMLKLCISVKPNVCESN